MHLNCGELMKSRNRKVIVIPAVILLIYLTSTGELPENNTNIEVLTSFFLILIGVVFLALNLDAVDTITLLLLYFPFFITIYHFYGGTAWTEAFILGLKLFSIFSLGVLIFLFLSFLKIEAFGRILRRIALLSFLIAGALLMFNFSALFLLSLSVMGYLAFLYISGTRK